MRQAVVTFDDEIVAEWGFEVFQDAGCRDAEVLSCEGSRGVVRIHVEEQVDEHRLDEMDAIQWWERVSDGPEEYVYLIEAGGAEWVDSIDSVDFETDRLPLTEQIEVTDEGLTLTFVGPQDQISDEITALADAGVGVSLEKLQGYRIQQTVLDALTERQLDVLEVAFDQGYYDVPRSTTTEEIAAELDLDDSTVSEHLQRAERNILRGALPN